LTNLNLIEKTLLSLKSVDLLGLIGVNGTIKRFYYGGGVYSIFKGKNGNLLIKNHNTTGSTIPYSKFLLDVGVAKNNNQLIDLINSKNFTQIEPITVNEINQTQTIETFKNSLIQANFETPFFENKLIEKLELKPLLNSYKSLLNSVLYFGNTNILLTKEVKNISNFRVNKINVVDGIGSNILRGLNLELLISNHLENREFNLRFKPKSEKWRTIKGAKNSGFYFKNPNSKNTTLYIVEGAKDGVNTFLVCGYDVFVNDNKNSISTKLIELIETKAYKNYIILNDRDDKSIFDTYKNKLTNLKNIYFLEWNKLENNFTDLADNADITDILKRLFENKTLREIKREFNKFIKDNLNDLELIASDKNLKILTEKFEYFKKIKNYKKIKNLFLKVGNELRKNSNYKSLFDNISEFLIYLRIYFKNTQTTQINEFLSEKKEHILQIINENFKNNLITFINAPTGSGKSTIVRAMSKDFRILIITPYKELNKEFKTEHIEQLEKLNNDVELEADLIAYRTKNKSIVLTTDRFIRNYKLINEVLFDEKYIDLIVFDEAHSIPQSNNFRSEVLLTHELLKNKFRKKVPTIYLSGTPTNFDSGDIFGYLKVERLKKTFIDYKIANENETLNIVLNEKLQNMEINQSILIYCSSINSIDELARYILSSVGKMNEVVNDVKIIKDVTVVCLTSKEVYYFDDDCKKVYYSDNTQLPKHKNIAYLSTSKGITGLNFPNLNNVFQYGTTYNPENTLQLFARLRGNGSITVFPIKDMINENKRDKTIGVLNALDRITKEFKNNSIKELIAKQPRFISELKKLSDLKEITIKSLYKNFKEELITLNSHKAINIKYSNIDNKVVIDDILIIKNNYQDILETYNDIQLNKQVDRLLSDYLIENIEIATKYYNTTQVFNVEKIQIKTKITKFKTDENKLEIKEKKEQNKTLKQIEIDRYFEIFEFNDYEKEKIYKFLKDVTIANITKFVNKAIEKNKDFIRAKFENIRTSTDFKIFVSFHLDVALHFKELLNELEYREFITVNELLETFTQKGYKLSARGSFKDEIQHLSELVNAISTKWEYAKETRVNYQKVKNIIKRNFEKSELELIKFLQKNQIKDIQKFVNFSGKSFSQLKNAYKEERVGLIRLIEEYLNQFEN
jgi:energy-coupling factor transporter ATP-binding protein EcfA2